MQSWISFESALLFLVYIKVCLHIWDDFLVHSRIAGEEWLVTATDIEHYIPDVGEVGLSQITFVSPCLL